MTLPYSVPLNNGLLVVMCRAKCGIVEVSEEFDAVADDKPECHMLQPVEVAQNKLLELADLLLPYPFLSLAFVSSLRKSMLELPLSDHPSSTLESSN